MAVPKPRTELARASARASKWAFGTPGLSKKQQEAARKNYDYINERLKETGGGLTDAELGIGKKWVSKPPPPKPKPRARAISPDAEDRGAAARERNATRGAATGGGPGRAERERARKAFTGAKKFRPQAVLEELERAGYDVPQGKPKTKAEADAMNKDVQADLKDYLSKLKLSEKAAFAAAAEDPFNIKRNTKIVGKEGATILYGHASKKYSQLDPMRPELPEPKTWADKIVDQGAAGIGKSPVFSGLGDAVPWFREVVAEDIKKIAVESMLGVPVLAETAYNDFTGRTKWGLAKLAMEGGKEFAKIVESGIPLDVYTLGRASWEVARTGDAQAGVEQIKKDFKRFTKAYSEKPVTTLINVIPGINMASRAGGFTAIAARMARLNPELPKHVILNAARKESYVPGWAARQGIKGGIPPKVFTGKIFDPDTGELMDTYKAPARSWSRTPVGRAAQRAGHAAGKEWTLPSGRVVTAGPLSETARAAAALNKRRGMEWERARVSAIQQMGPITRYVQTAKIPKAMKDRYLNAIAEHRTRLAETFWGPQGPHRASPEDILEAVANDLRTMSEEGGIDIPTKKKAAIDKELDKLDRTLRKLGLPIDESAGMWGQAQDLMREAGRPEPEIRTYLELAKARARVWASEGEGRSPQDWLDSEDGRNLAGFAFGEPGVGFSLAQAVERAGPHIPNLQLPEERTAKNLSAKTSGRSKATGIPDTPDLRTTLDGKEFQIAGDVTPESWVERVEALVPDVAAQENLARWYEHYVPMFRRAFGKDANAIMRGFAVSQANASPASGLSAVLRIMDAVRDGKKVGKKGYGSVVSENIAKAVEDGVIDSFVAAKLSDFINSLEGRSTRTWMQDHPDAGMPAAVDVHAIRDRGFVDEKLVARMESVHGYKPGEDYIVEGDGTAQGGKYERIAEWYKTIADHLNDIEHNGRKDWTPAQAQALGWSVIQLAHKTVPEGFAEAFAYNTRAITFEVTKGPGELGAGLSLKQSRAASRAMLKDAKRLIKEIDGLYLVDARVGTGGWKQSGNSNITVRVMGSKAKVQEALTIFAQAFDQEWVQATREVSGANSRSTLIIRSPSFKNPEQAVTFFEALNRINPDLQGFVDYDVNGTPGMAIRTDSPSVSPKTQMAFLRRHLDAVRQASEETGIDVGLGVRNMEMITGGQHGGVDPVSTLPGRGGGLRRAELDDPRASRIRERLEGVVGDVEGGRAPGPEGAAPGRGERNPVRTLYQADQPYRRDELKGYETRIPVLISRDDMSKTIVGRPGDTHSDIAPGRVNPGTGMIEPELEGYFQTQITIDPTDGKVLYAPREIGDVEAQKVVDAYVELHYPDGLHGQGGPGPQIPEGTAIERHEITEPSTWGHEGTSRVPWIYDPDSGILHIGTPGSDHGQLSRKVYDKYGYNESLNREWVGIWAPTSERVVLHGNETGDMPSPDFPLDPRLGPLVKEAFGKKMKQWDHETGEILDMPEDSGAIGYGRQTQFQADPDSPDIRGAVEFIDSHSGRQLLYLSEKANASTFGHELFGHAAGEMKKNYPELFAGVEQRYGKAYEDWSVTEHERFARETERYLMSGKAPTPELEPIFSQMRQWMYHVYETIKALGRPMPKETRVLLDRYFGKVPMEFEAPKNVYRRTSLPDSSDVAGIERLVDETTEMLARGNLDSKPVDRKTIAGNMLWLEQQVLPYINELDGRVATKVKDTFEAFDEVKAGKSIFTPEQARAIRDYGVLIGQRGREMEKSEMRLAAQPDFVKTRMARDIIDAFDDPDLDLEGLADVSDDLHSLMYEWDQKTKYDDARQKRLKQQIGDIERALDPNRRDVTKAQRDEAIMAVREISELNEEIYIKVFGEGLSPEELARFRDALERRKNIMARRLKEIGELPEGSGEGAYLPHYSIYDMVQSKLRGAVRLPAAGGNRKILSLEPRKTKGAFGGKGGNRLVRYQTGELAVTPAGLLSQYMQRMRFVETSNLRKELFDIGVELPRDRDGKTTGRVPRGWYVINGTGAAMPERIKSLMKMSDEQIDEMLAAGEDIDAKISSDSGLTKTLEEYRNNFLQRTYTGRIPDDFQGEMVRMLPPEVVEKMVGKVFESAPGGRFGATMGMLASLGRFSTIYAHAPGYVGANVAANTVMLAFTRPTQFYRGLREFGKMGTTVRSKHPELYEWVASEGGDVMAEAGLPDFYVMEQNRFERAERAMTNFSSRWAGGLGDIADRPFRVAAWIGEAKREGFTNIDQWNELRRADPENPADAELVRVRNTIAQRTRENMIDFNKLNAAEKAASRWVFIWPFIRGATKLPFWYMSEYPGRAAFLANLARAQNAAYGEDDPETVLERYNKKATVGERSMFDLFEVPLPPGLGGGSLNLSPIHPIGVLAEKADELGKLAGGDVKVIGDILNPSFRTGGQAIFGDRGFDPKALGEVVVPWYSYYRAATEPRKRGAQKYNDRDSFWDYIRRREGRFWPEDVDFEKVKEAKEKEVKESDKRPSWEKEAEADIEKVDTIVKAIEEKGGSVDPAYLAKVKKSVQAYHELDRAEDAYKDELGVNDLTMEQKVEATARVYMKYRPDATLMTPEAVAELPDKVRGRNAGWSKEKYRQWMRDELQKDRSEYMTYGKDIKAIEDD